MAVAIMLSSFGCNNGLILAGARVYYAMAKDGLFFRSVAKLNPTHKTPAVSLMVQMVWTCVLCVSGSYGQLLDYIIFAVLVFYILTIIGLFVLRRTHPDAERPYRAIGYPGVAGDLYCDGIVHRCRTITLQAAVHVAGVDHRACWGFRCTSCGHGLRVRQPQAGQLKLRRNQGNGKSAGYKAAALADGGGRETGEHSLKRTLGVFQLTALGVGAIIGAGIFVMVGLGAHYAGPGLTLSFVLSGLGMRVCRLVLRRVCGHDSAGGQRLHLCLCHAG